MNRMQILKKKILIFYVYLLLLMSFSHLYYNLLSPYMGIWFAILIDAAWLLTGLVVIRKWLRQTSEKIVRIVEQTSNDPNYSKEVSRIINSDAFHGDIIRMIVNYQNTQQMEQQRLMDQLTYSNTMLERSSRITDSIMQITSEILASGEIDQILQTILDKALELIPNAQKGSILLYNGHNLEFRATYGYNPEAFKDITLDVEELFLYSLPDFYEPCIINDPESFNKKHMSQDKFEKLRENEVFKLKSILSCAIKVENDFLGVINLDCVEGCDTFSKDDMPLIKHLANQIGIALKNARLLEKTLYLSKHDSLTGVHNRCSFEDYLMRVYQQSIASGGLFSLVLLDINDLKKVNDTYGHEAGDLMLMAFVRGINKLLEAEGLFARYGGDEFALVFPALGREQAEEKLKSAMAAFDESPLMYCGKKIGSISFSYGVTEFPTDTTDFNELIKLSDMRMYKNKEESKKPIS